MSRMTVNERPVEFDLDPRMPLLYALREAMNLTGTKACGGGTECSGACMVIVDAPCRRRPLPRFCTATTAARAMPTGSSPG